MMFFREKFIQQVRLDIDLRLKRYMISELLAPALLEGKKSLERGFNDEVDSENDLDWEMNSARVVMANALNIDEKHLLRLKEILEIRGAKAFAANVRLFVGHHWDDPYTHTYARDEVKTETWWIEEGK